MRETQLLQKDLRPLIITGCTHSLGIYSVFTHRADEWCGAFTGDHQPTLQLLKDTGELSYNILIKKRFYREAKLHFIAQQYKILAKAISRAQCDPKSLRGLVLICFSDNRWWMGVTGDIDIFHFQNKNIQKISAQKVSELVFPFETTLGDFYMQPLEGHFKRGDVFVVCTHSILQSLSQKKSQVFFKMDWITNGLVQILLKQ